jgi:hypothetical protein
LSTPNSSQELLLLLGRLEGKLDGIQATLHSIQQRADGHEIRISSLERDLATSEAQREWLHQKVEGLEKEAVVLNAWKSEHAGMEKKAAILASTMKIMVGAAIPVVIWAANYFIG